MSTDSATARDCEVLVIGAGPTGLMAANLLDGETLAAGQGAFIAIPRGALYADLLGSQIDEVPA